MKNLTPMRNVEEASINVLNKKDLDPKHELSEDDTKDMLEYNNNNIIDHNGITPPFFRNNPDFRLIWRSVWRCKTFSNILLQWS